MTIIQTIILGIVEGITEFLPVSSTAHIEFAGQIMGIIQTDFFKSFTIAIQLGAIIAVVILYRKKLLNSKKTWQNIIIGFIPTGIIGFVLYKIIKGFLLGNIWIAMAMLILGGIIILFFEKQFAKKSEASSVQSIDDLSSWDMVKLGMIQAIAVIPGVSRSGALIIGGMGIGIPRTVIIETAFLLAIPTMIAATGYDLLKNGIAFARNEWGMVILGMIVSGMVAFIVAKWLLKFITQHSFRVFGWYRIIVGIVLVAVFVFWK